jgi:hypothetical protein
LLFEFLGLEPFARCWVWLEPHRCYPKLSMAPSKRIELDWGLLSKRIEFLYALGMTIERWIQIYFWDVL